MSKELVKIASFADEAEAQLYRSVLAGHGIQSFVQRSAVSTLFGSNSMIASVELHARAADAETAIEILETAHEADPNSTPWYCDDCEEMIEAGFQVCWSCGKDRPADGLSPVATVVKDVSFADPEQRDAPNRDLTNPYVTPHSDLAGDPSTDELEAETAEDDEDDLPLSAQDEAAQKQITRALRAALIGFFFFPFVGHLYSLYLLNATNSSKEGMSKKWRRKWNWTFLIDVAAVCVWILVCASYGMIR